MLFTRKIFSFYCDFEVPVYPRKEVVWPYFETCHWLEKLGLPIDLVAAWFLNIGDGTKSSF